MENQGSESKIVKITEKALEWLLQRTKKENTDTIKIWLRGGGCKGFTLNINFAQPLSTWSEAEKTSWIIEQHALTENNSLNVAVNEKAKWHLQGALIEKSQGGLNRPELEIQLPKSQGSCGCGQSFDFKPQSFEV